VSATGTSFAFGAAPPTAAEAARVRELLPEIELLVAPERRETVVALWVHAWRVSPWDDPDDAYNSVSRLPEGHDPHRERWHQIAHTRAVVALVVAMLPTLRDHCGAPVDREEVLTLALIHDVAKLAEYGPGPDGPVKTAVGRAIHHANVGGQWALEAGLGPEMAQGVVAHSPSAKDPPATAAGLVLKLADQVITDVNRMVTAQETNQEVRS
jgi:hypothetical protein